MQLLKSAVFTTAFLLSTAMSHAEEPWRGGAFRSTVILTVTGDVVKATRGESDETVDKFFTFNGHSFTNAAQFDYSSLSTLEQQTLTTDFPMGGDSVSFEGPLLSDVFDAAGAQGAMVTLTALDGYAIEVPFDELVEKGAVLALKRDDIPFGIGDFGPAHLVFPRADRADLAEMNDDWWIWSIYHINIE